jgi:hypothetical protein
MPDAIKLMHGLDAPTSAELLDQMRRIILNLQATLASGGIDPHYTWVVVADGLDDVSDLLVGMQK